jgi:hypothetical protein
VPFKDLFEIRRTSIGTDPDLVRGYLREMQGRLFGETSEGRCEGCQKSLGDMSDPEAWRPHRHGDALRDRGGPWGDYEVLCTQCFALVTDLAPPGP